MTFKRFIAVTLALLLLLGALPGMLPAALAKPNEYGCPNSSNEKHDWDGARYREPWCEWAGGYIYVCRKCHKEVFEETAPALGHKWPEWTVTKEPTCTQKGSRTRTCNRCHKVETQELSSLGHSFTKPWTTVKAPTCEGAGQEVNYCTRCGYEWRRELEATGHDWDDGVVTKEPTETKDGEILYTCKNDPSHTRTEVLPATVKDPQPGLTITWLYDQIWIRGYGIMDTTDPYELGSEDGAWAWHEVRNTGNIHLAIVSYCIYGNGTGFDLLLSDWMDPDGYDWWGFGSYYAKDKITPGTETADLLGTMTVSIYAVGYDPDTFVDADNPGTELCRTDTITRTWNIHRPDDNSALDFCSLTLNSLGDAEARYTLHTCTEHLETAEAAEALALAGDWAGAVELWRAELEAFFEIPDGLVGDEMPEKLNAEEEALFAYADAVQALCGDEAAADLLRLRCAQLCCILRTAPEKLPSSLTGEWEALDAATYEISSREIGALDGSDCLVTEYYAGSAAEAMAGTKSLIDPASETEDAFVQGMDFWKAAMDDTVNAAYKASDKDTEALIANWRVSLTMLCDADEEFYALFYADDPAMTQELLMNLYKDAALLADSIR